MVEREVVLLVESLISSCSIPQCRICHEEEEEIENCKKLESPCACSGTVKFAHRECIQRWCNEKGNTICEICLQKFEPGYTAPQTKAKGTTDIAVTVRGSLDDSNEEIDTENSDCSSLAQLSASFFRFISIAFVMLFLVRNLLSMLTITTNHYTITLLIVLILRVGVILIPIYVLVRAIEAIQNGFQHLNQESEGPLIFDGRDEEDTPTIQVHTNDFE